MASWFINQASAHSSFADHLANLLGLATAGTSHAAGAPAGFTVGLAGTVTTAFIAIVLGIIAFLATVIQIMLMLVRGGMLVLLVGTLPLVAAFSNTEMGHAVVPQSRRVAARVRAVQAGGGDRVRGRVRSRRPAGRAGAAGRRDDAGARDPRAAGAAAVRGARDERARGRRRAGGDARGAAGGAIAMRMPTGAASVAVTPASAYGQGRAGRPAYGRRAQVPRSPAPGRAAAAGMNGGAGQSGAPAERAARARRAARAPAARSQRAPSSRRRGGRRGGGGAASGGPGAGGAVRPARRRRRSRSFRRTGRGERARRSGAVESSNA